MKDIFIRMLLAALEDERVREALLEIILEYQERQPEISVHRPISGKAPGAI